jgi:hypothetical protein
MKKFRFGVAAAALALVVGLFTLAVPDAKAATIQLGNAQFQNGLNGWTTNIYQPVPSIFGYGWIEGRVDNNPLYTARGIHGYAVMGCEGVCPASKSNTLSQMVTGLTPGNTYQLSFYLASIGGDGVDGHGAVPVGPVRVSLGSQTSADITDEGFIVTGNDPIPFTKETVTFNYTGPGTSAMLTFIQQFAGLVHSCVPCSAGEDIWIGNPVLTDVSPPAAPKLKVQKALGAGGRINSADQFLLAIRNATTNAALNSASTSGTGSAVTSAAVSITPDTTTSYKVTEEMATGSSSATTQYTASLSCSNANSSGTQIPSTIKVGDNFPLLKAGDDISCTLTNTAKPVAAATLQIRQSVLSPVPPNLLPPYTFQYTGNNGWSAPAITNTALNQAQSSAPIALNATGVATTVSTKLPDNRWFVAAFSCSDLSAPASGNPTGTLVKSTTPTVTIPASFVRPGATLRCAMALGHATP